MTDKRAVAILKELIEAARPFLSGDIVDEATVTIMLMDRLEGAIAEAEDLLRSVEAIA